MATTDQRLERFMMRTPGDEGDTPVSSHLTTEYLTDERAIFDRPSDIKSSDCLGEPRAKRCCASGAAEPTPREKCNSSGTAYSRPRRLASVGLPCLSDADVRTRTEMANPCH